jgi:hypothetical protein
MTRSGLMISNNKLAILIIAHKNLNQLLRLLKRIKHDRIDIFVHIDQKWDLSEKDLESIRSIDKKSIFVIEKRISVSLDTWSLIEATMELIKQSKNIESRKGINYKYTALLSAQDYPIKNIDSFIELLNRSYPKPFIDVTPYDNNNWLYSKFHRFSSENKMNMLINSKIKPGVFRRVIKLPIYLTFRLIGLFYDNPYKKFIKLNCKLYGGSAWWVLPDLAIHYINERYHNPNDKIIEVLKQTYTPEETFFQIMVMQSILASRVELNSKFTVSQNCLTYAHFTDVGKPFNGHPYHFEAVDLKKLMRLPHYFARKFDDTVDKVILDLIDQRILNIKIESDVNNA